MLAAHPINQERAARGQPPVNAVITRGAGRVHRLPTLEYRGVPLRLTTISGDQTILGLTAWLGGETVRQPGMTGNLDTDLEGKFTAARAALGHNDLVVLHLKGADIAAHDFDPRAKVAFIEAVDRELARLLADCPGPLRVALASDHATLCETGRHAEDPVPVVIWGEGVEPDGVERFDEAAAAEGSLQRFPLQLLIERLSEGG